MKHLMGIMAIIAVTILLTTGAYADGYRLYTQVGGMTLDECDISEGHKSFHVLGLEKDLGNFTLGIEGLHRGEAEDNDPELLKWGMAAQIKYNFNPDWELYDVILKPWVQIRYDHMERGVAPKYEHEVTGYKQTTVHKFFSGGAGMRFDTRFAYLDLGVTCPFLTNTKSGNFGPLVKLGIPLGEKWEVAGTYKEIRFTDTHLKSGDSDVEFKFAGIELSYKF